MPEPRIPHPITIPRNYRRQLSSKASATNTAPTCRGAYPLRRCEPCASVVAAARAGLFCLSPGVKVSVIGRPDTQFVAFSFPFQHPDSHIWPRTTPPYLRQRPSNARHSTLRVTDRRAPALHNCLKVLLVHQPGSWRCWYSVCCLAAKEEHIRSKRWQQQD
jgi:hypothetical protein